MSCSDDKCSCRNRAKFEPCGLLNPCCEFCPNGSPCAYDILAKCEYAKAGLFLHHITRLWKACLFECHWWARRCNNGPGDAECQAVFASGLADTMARQLLGCGDDQVTGSPFDPYPKKGTSEAADCDGALSLVQEIPPVCSEDGDYKATRLLNKCDPMPSPLPFFLESIGDPNFTIPYQCGFYDWYGADVSSDTNNITNPTKYQEFIDECTVLVWDLEVTSETTATLTGHYEGTDDSGYGIVDKTVVYECNDWVCVPEPSGLDDDDGHGNTFAMINYPNDDHPALPKNLCVVPSSANWQTPCNPPTAACNCCDPGNRNAYFTFAPFETCLTEEKTIVVGRNVTLPSGVTDPAGACGYFWGSTGYCDGVTTGVLTWCDGTDWNASLYCSTDSGTTFTELCTTVGTMTECCPGNAVTYDCAIEDFGDCCCETTVNICSCDIPTTLYGTISLTGCDIDGQVVTLTFDGTNRWLGTIVSASCGTLTVRAEITSCNWSVAISSGPSTFCMNSTPTSPGTECPVTSLVASNTWDNTACSCCSGTITVTVTP